MARDTRKTLKKGGMKNENHFHNVSQRNNDNKIIFIFCIGKRIYLVQKHSLVRYYYISSKVFFSVAGYLK